MDDSLSCSPCGKGFYCPGGTKPRQLCGELLTTAEPTAANFTGCITLPGVAYMEGIGTATKCPANTYNVGFNQRNCTDCPGELVTADKGASSIEACSAPAGWFYRASNRQALPCAQGSYKTDISKEPACQACPEGTTTLSIAATSATNCSVVLPGYEPVYDLAGELVMGATPCPAGTYSPAGQQCIACPGGLLTQREKSSSITSCLAPPGYGYYPSGVPFEFADAFTLHLNQLSVPCPVGRYKSSGWDLNECSSCGINLLTDAVSSTSPDACYIPAGWGSKSVYTSITSSNAGNIAPLNYYTTSAGTAEAGGESGAQQLVATKCHLGSYGTDKKHYGLEPMPCQPCPEFTTTPDAFPEILALNETERADALSGMLITSVLHCSNLPGYGWQYGIAVECAVGEYNSGYNWKPCESCGSGLSTAKGGSTGITDCLAQPGWHLDGLGSASPCLAGTWSAGGTTSHCIACPPGSTSKPTAGAVTECNLCLPGWGITATTSNSTSLCAPCDYGYYSPGGVGPCIPCEKGYTSPGQSTDSSACIPMWFSLEPYSGISVSISSLLESAAKNETSASCQASCAASPECQFWVHRGGRDNQTAIGCWLKLTTVAPVADTYIAYKLVHGNYAVYPADKGIDAKLGNSVAWTASALEERAPKSPNDCMGICDNRAACLGVWVSSTSSKVSSTGVDGKVGIMGITNSATTEVTSNWECRLLAGEFRRGETSAVQAVPERINNIPWDAHDCTATWSDFGPCNASCGGGQQFSTYQIISQARNGGCQCEYAQGATKSKACNVEPCPSVTAPVDCVGSFSTWSRCSAQCGTGMQLSIFTVTTPAAFGGHECEAADGTIEYQTCNTQPCNAKAQAILLQPNFNTSTSPSTGQGSTTGNTSAMLNLPSITTAASTNTLQGANTSATNTPPATKGSHVTSSLPDASTSNATAGPSNTAEGTGSVAVEPASTTNTNLPGSSPARNNTSGYSTNLLGGRLTTEQTANVSGGHDTGVPINASRLHVTNTSSIPAPGHMPDSNVTVRHDVNITASNPANELPQSNATGNSSGVRNSRPANASIQLTNSTHRVASNVAAAYATGSGTAEGIKAPAGNIATTNTSSELPTASNGTVGVNTSAGNTTPANTSTGLSLANSTSTLPSTNAPATITTGKSTALAPAAAPSVSLVDYTADNSTSKRATANMSAQPDVTMGAPVINTTGDSTSELPTGGRPSNLPEVKTTTEAPASKVRPEDPAADGPSVNTTATLPRTGNNIADTPTISNITEAPAAKGADHNTQLPSTNDPVASNMSASLTTNTTVGPSTSAPDTSNSSTHQGPDATSSGRNQSPAQHGVANNSDVLVRPSDANTAPDEVHNSTEAQDLARNSSASNMPGWNASTTNMPTDSMWNQSTNTPSAVNATAALSTGNATDMPANSSNAASVDCVGDWGPWTACSALCNGGVQSSYFVITTPRTRGGEECIAQNGTARRQTCNEAACNDSAAALKPVDCVGSWNMLLPCNATCRQGWQPAVYRIVTPASNKGKPCEWTSGTQQNFTCFSQPCPPDVLVGNSTANSITTSNSSAGRNATGNTITATNGSSAGNSKSAGSTIDNEEATPQRPSASNTPAEQPNANVDCIGSWSNWTECSEPCAGGQQSCMFLVSVPASGDGELCPVSNGTVQKRPCNTDPCTEPPLDYNTSANNSTPTQNTSQSSSMPIPGNASVLIDQHVANSLPSTTADTGLLSLQHNTAVPSTDLSKYEAVPASVNCVGQWGSWGNCSRPCGGGVRQGVFKVTSPAVEGGQECEVADGTLSRFVCNPQQCSTNDLPQSQPTSRKDPVNALLHLFK